MRKRREVQTWIARRDLVRRFIQSCHRPLLDIRSAYPCCATASQKQTLLGPATFLGPRCASDEEHDEWLRFIPAIYSQTVRARESGEGKRRIERSLAPNVKDGDNLNTGGRRRVHDRHKKGGYPLYHFRKHRCMTRGTGHTHTSWLAG